MPQDAPKLAMLNAQQVAKVRELEAQLGDDVVILAYDKPLEPAELTDEQVEKIKQAEAELEKVYLVVYKNPLSP